MNKLFIFLVIVISLQACSSEKQQSNESKASQIHEKQQSEIIANKPNQFIDVKKDPNDFIPEGYVIHTYEGGSFSEGWNEIKGDLNKDGLEDRVLIIKGTDKSKIIVDEYRGELDRNRRGIIVLLNKGDHYQCVSKNYNCFSSENEDGGIYFAPELDVYINNGNLNIYYGHGRYGYWSYTFRYQNNAIELIGFDLHSSHGPVPQYEVSINFMTKKKLIRDNLNKDNLGDEYTEKYKETWKRINFKELIKLSEIEDFDALDFDL